MSASRWSLAALALSAVAGCASRSAPEPIWVGHLAPLSGPDRALGEHARQGIQLAVDEATAEDRRVGNRPVQVLHVDNRGDAEMAQAEAVRLLSVNKVAALIAGPQAEAAARVARTAQSYPVPVLLPTELADPPQGEGEFALGASPSYRGQVLARRAQELPGDRAAVVSDGGNAVATALAAAFGKEYARDGKHTFSEWSYRNDAEQNALAERVAGAKPAVVLLAANVRDFSKVRGQLESAGVKAPLLYGGEDAGVLALQADPGRNEVYLATVFTADGLTAQGQDFRKRYEEAFHEAPDLCAAQAYDSFRLVLDTMVRLRTPAGQRLREGLAGLESFETVTGPLAWKERRARRPLFLMQLKEKQAVLVKTVAAEGE
jgi:branched-chain amino acid transport system substrate-binding protein